MQHDPGDRPPGPERHHPVADVGSTDVHGQQQPPQAQHVMTGGTVSGGPRANVQSAQAAATELRVIEAGIDDQYKPSEWHTNRQAWIGQCESCRTIRDVVEALIELDNHLPFLAALRMPQHVRDAWRARLRTLHTYPTLTNAINHYRNDIMQVIASSAPPPPRAPPHQHLGGGPHDDTPTPPLWQLQPPSQPPPPTAAQHGPPPPDATRGRHSVEGTKEGPPSNHVPNRGAPAAAAKGGGPAAAGHTTGDDAATPAVATPASAASHGQQWDLLTATAGLGQLVAALDTRAQAVEHRVTHMEARCSLLDTMLHQHVVSTEQSNLQMQLKVLELSDALHDLAARLRVCEQRTVRTTEESEGRLDAVLSGVVQALQRQDATDTVQLQLTNMSHVLTNLSHKIEVVETSMLTGSHEGKQEGKSRNVGGEGNLASPPVGGVSPTCIALPSVAEEVIQELARRRVDDGGGNERDAVS